MPFRLLVAVSVLALGAGVVLLVHVGSVAPVADRTAQGAARSATAATRGPDDPLEVLHVWDRRRAAAWAHGDAAALGRLYVTGSRARSADLALLRHYTDRGLVVSGLRMQVLRARVLVDRRRVLVLEVTERLATARAAPAAVLSASRALPAGRVSTHLVRFRKVGAAWLVAAVTSPRG